MQKRSTVVLAAVFALSLGGVSSVAAQTTQSEIALWLVEGNTSERAQAMNRVMSFDPEEIGPELRGAMIAALEREGDVHERVRRGEGERAENPEMMGQLALVVVEFRDPAAIPALAKAISHSPPARQALARFGELGVRAVLNNFPEPGAEGGMSPVIAGLRTLRYALELHGKDGLSSNALTRIRDIAEERLTGSQYVVPLKAATDLAWVLGDPELMDVVRELATSRDAIVARGITEPDGINEVQQNAADRLKGIPPLPRPER